MATAGVVDLSQLTTAQQNFTFAVSSQTGLALATVGAWVKAENGPDGNPLNIGPGRNYGSVAAAAKATVALLNTSAYRPILATTAESVPDQIQAIAASPWDAGHYTGSGTNTPKPGVPFGTTLLGALAALTHGSTLAGQAGGAVKTAADAPVQAAADAATGVEGWIRNEASLGLAYIVLTLLGIALVFFGLLDVFGYSPRRVAGAITPTAAAAAADIPF